MKDKTKKDSDIYPKISYSAENRPMSITNTIGWNIPITIQALPKDWRALDQYLSESQHYEPTFDFGKEFFRTFIRWSWSKVGKQFFTPRKFIMAMKLQSFLLYTFFVHFEGEKLPKYLNKLEIDEHCLELLRKGDPSAPTLLAAYCMQKKYGGYLRKLLYFSTPQAGWIPQAPPPTKLLNAVRRDAYYPFLSTSGSAATLLNRLLECPDFFDVLYQRKKSTILIKSGKDLEDMYLNRQRIPRKGKREGRKTNWAEIMGLDRRTKDYRKKNFAELTPSEKYWIIRLNKMLLEKIYPELIPKGQTLRKVNPFYEEDIGEDIETDNFSITYINDGRNFLKSKDLNPTLKFLLRISAPAENMRGQKTPHISAFVFEMNSCFDIFLKEQIKKDISKISEQSLQNYLVEKISSAS